MSKERIYTDEAKTALYTLNKSKKYITILIVIVCIFFVFFTSKIYLPPKAVEDETILKKEIEFSDDRNVTILSAIYDKDAKQIELMLVYNNGAGDGINEYYYAIDGTGSPGFSINRISIEEVLQDPLCTVIHINNVRFFKEIVLYLAPKLNNDISKIKDADTATLVFTKNNLVEGKIIDKNRVDYINDRLDISINTISEKIKYHKERINNYNNKINNLNSEINNLNESLKMITGEEYNIAVENIETNTSKIEDYKKAIATCNIYIEDYQNQIKQLKKNKETLNNEDITQ